jgi:hypothetical protein
MLLRLSLRRRYCIISYVRQTPFPLPTIASVLSGPNVHFRLPACIIVSRENHLHLLGPVVRLGEDDGQRLAEVGEARVGGDGSAGALQAVERGSEVQYLAADF